MEVIDSVQCVTHHHIYTPLVRPPGVHEMEEEQHTIITRNESEIEEREKKRQQLEELYGEKRKSKTFWFWPMMCSSPRKLFSTKRAPKPTLPADFIKIIKTKPMFAMKTEEDALSMIEPSELSSIEHKGFDIISSIRKLSHRIMFGKKKENSVIPEESEIALFEDDFITFVCGNGISSRKKGWSWRSCGKHT